MRFARSTSSRSSASSVARRMRRRRPPGRRRRPGRLRRDGSGRHGLGPRDAGTVRAQRRPRPAPAAAPPARRSRARRSEGHGAFAVHPLRGRAPCWRDASVSRPRSSTPSRHAYERWDGKGFPAGLEGDAIPLAVRVVVVARDADLATRLGEDPRGGCTSEEAGRTTLPSSTPSRGWGRRPLELASARRVGVSPSRGEPEPATIVGPDTLDAVLTAFADFADLKSPWIRATPAQSLRSPRRHAATPGSTTPSCDDLRRAGLVHDLGRVAVENGIWDKPGPLTTSEWERVRLHPVLHGADPRPLPFAQPWSGRPRRTTSASTGPGITARSLPRPCPGALASWPRRTCSPRSPPTGRIAPRSRTTKPHARSKPRLEVTSTQTRSPACSPPPASGRLPRRPRGRPTSPTGKWRCSA